MAKNIILNDDTKENIITAFWNIYKETNINKITASEIIGKAGYNRSTFYYYFKNTKEILDYIENRIIEALASIIIKNKTSKNPSNETFVTDLIKFYNTYGNDICILLRRTSDSNFLTKFEKKTKEIYYKYHRYKLGEESKFELIYAFITSAFVGSFLYWSNNKSKLSIDEFLKVSLSLSDSMFNNINSKKK